MGLFRATVDCNFNIGSGGGTNTWHLRTVSTDGSTTEVDGLMELVRLFYDDLKPYFSTSYSWSWDGLVSEVGVPDPALLEQGTAWTVAGTVTTSPYSGAPSMACVTWRSALATRRGRGRTFLGPLAADTIQDNGTLKDAFVADVRTAASTLVSSSLSDLNGALVVFSELDGIGRDFIASSVTDQVAVLRSRR